MLSRSHKNFNYVSYIAKAVALVIALILIAFSRYTLVFFLIAMLPTIFAILLDKNDHKCFSASICSFNLIGIMPYLEKIWHSHSVSYTSKVIIAEFETWVVIYGAAFIGQLLYISMPLIIVKIYSLKIKTESTQYEKQYEELRKKWNIDSV